MQFGVFTPAQARSSAETRLSKDAYRAKELSELTKEILDAKDEAERSFEATMARQRKAQEDWEQEQKERKHTLTHEVEELEHRRTQALMPLELTQEALHLREEEILNQELSLNERKATLEEEARLLMQKLDEVTAKEQELGRRELRVKHMEEGAQKQHLQVAESAKEVNLRIEEFKQVKDAEEEKLAFRQSELDAKEQLHKVNEQTLEKEREKIKEEWRLIADSRLLLEKGFEELRSKHG